MFLLSNMGKWWLQAYLRSWSSVAFSLPLLLVGVGVMERGLQVRRSCIFFLVVLVL